MPSETPHKTFDKAHFETLFKSHFAFLVNFARQFVDDIDTAQDLTQKVFITLWEKRADIDPKQSIKSYLFTAVRNRCLNYIRDQKKYRSKVLDIEMADFEVAIEEDHFGEEELKQKIEAALSSLPEKCRLVFEMSRFQQMKYKEIAEELEISQKTVEAHMSKAIKSLRAYLEAYMWICLVLLNDF
ncbi:MAG: RNA polymerase sigma-70 factor [Bacteroidota bacterium]